LRGPCILTAGPTPFPAAGRRQRAAQQGNGRDQGQTLPEYRHRGTGWVAGTPGHRYAVRLTNTTGARVLAVLSGDPSLIHN